MHRHIPTGLKRIDDLVGKFGHGLARSRNPSIRNWEWLEIDSTSRRGCALLLENELHFLFRLEERHHNIDASFTPGGGLVLQPVTAARPRQDTHFAAPWPRNPVHLGSHASSFLAARQTLARKRVDIDTTLAQNDETMELEWFVYGHLRNDRSGRATLVRFLPVLDKSL